MEGASTRSTRRKCRAIAGLPPFSGIDDRLETPLPQFVDHRIIGEVVVNGGYRDVSHGQRMGVRIAVFVLLDGCVCQPVIDMTSRVYPAIVPFNALEIALPGYADSADFAGGQVRDVDIEAYAGRQPLFSNHGDKFGNEFGCGAETNRRKGID